MNIVTFSTAFHSPGAGVSWRMNVYFLRHGLAVDRGTADFEDDSERPLTSKGRRQLKISAVTMKKMGLRLDWILSSPFRRAQQTAEIVAEELKLKKRLKCSEALKPNGDPQNLIREVNRLRPAPKNLLLVGHEPYLSQLISQLVSGGEHLVMDFKKGGLGKVEIEKLAFGRCATLAWLLTPGQMKWMS
jgi:phosphohistidine phosphatase